MAQRETRDVDVVCPCCGARLKVDAELSKVISHEPPPRPTKAPDLDRVGQLLEKERARREAMFKQSERDEKVKSDLLDRKFAEALKKTKDEPVTRPTRDIDLD
jgi:predicted amidophosphoribosyltransferase